MLEELTLIIEAGILILLAIEVYMGYWQMRALKRMEANALKNDAVANDVSGMTFDKNIITVARKDKK